MSRGITDPKFKNDMSRIVRIIIVASFLISALVAGASSGYAQSAFDDPGSRVQNGKAGDLKPVNDKVDAGDVALGSSAQVVVLFKNEDSKPITTGVINLYPSSNISASIGENQCASAAISPGEICAISVQVKGLQKGNYRIEMLMRHDGRAKLLTTTIKGNVVSSGDNATDLSGDIEAIPASVEFGSLSESRSQMKAVILRNKTPKPISINSIDLESGNQSGFKIDSNCKELNTGEACVASVTWTPQQRGPSTGTLIVHHTGATAIATIDLSGTYTPENAQTAQVFPEAIPGKGLLVSSMDKVDFGSGVSQSASITLSLVNTGDVPLTLTDIRMANSDNGIRTERDGCASGTRLTPLEACPLTLTWDPVREGNVVDDLQISHTGARGILVIPLRGSAARAVNKDKKAILLTPVAGPEAILKNIRPLTLDDIEDDGEEVIESGSAATVKKETSDKKTGSKKSSSSKTKETPKAASDETVSVAGTFPQQVDVRGILDGYVITSYSPKRAIVSGPGGSRVVFDGEQTVIGGVLWEISMRPSAVEFRSGDQKVLLLFDKSLSSVNVLNAESGSGSSTSGTSTTSSSSTQ